MKQKRSFFPDSFLNSPDYEKFEGNLESLDIAFEKLFLSEFELAVINGTIEHAADQNYYDYFMHMYRLPFHTGDPFADIWLAKDETDSEIQRLKLQAVHGKRIKKIATPDLWGSLMKCDTGEIFLVGTGQKDSPIFSYDPFDASYREKGDGTRFMTPKRLEELKRWFVHMTTKHKEDKTMSNILIQQGKKENQFKLFEMKNGNDGPMLTPIGFEGLGTAYPELSKFEHWKGMTLLYKSHETAPNGAPVDIVSALQKVFKDAKIVYSNNYSCGQTEDITNLPKEYSYSAR